MCSKSVAIASMLAIGVGLTACGGNSDKKDDDQIDLASLTAQDINDSLDVANAIKIDGDLLPGADTGLEPQITEVILPETIEFAKVFQVEVKYQTGTDSLAKLFVQTEGAQGYFEMSMSAVPNTAGSVSFPLIVSAPKSALTKAFGLVVQLEGAGGAPGLSSSAGLTMSDRPPVVYVPACGNDTVDVATEQCDDGNTVAGDGCSATCQNEGPACDALPVPAGANGSVSLPTGDVSAGDAFATVSVKAGAYGPIKTLTIHFVALSDIGACDLHASHHVFNNGSYFTAVVSAMSSSSGVEPALPTIGKYDYLEYSSQVLNAYRMSESGLGTVDSSLGICELIPPWPCDGMPTGSLWIDQISSQQVEGHFTWTDACEGITSSATFVAPICDASDTGQENCCY